MAASSSFLLLFNLLFVGPLFPLLSSALDVTDADVGSDEALFALYNKWRAVHRSHANGDVARFNVFKTNVRKIHGSNKNSQVSYKLGLNKFAEMTVDEFRAVYTRARSYMAQIQSVDEVARAESIPESVDWRVRGDHVVIDGYADVPTNNEEALLRAVVGQPVSVGIDGGAFPFMFYEKGVFSGRCTTRMNHGVTIVGYGETKDGVKYWTVKNSWGKDWGEEGYVRIVRGEAAPEGHCGINQWASYPIKNSPNPTHPILITQYRAMKSGQSISA